MGHDDDRKGENDGHPYRETYEQAYGPKSSGDRLRTGKDGETARKNEEHAGKIEKGLHGDATNERQNHGSESGPNFNRTYEKNQQTDKDNQFGSNDPSHTGSFAAGRHAGVEPVKDKDKSEK